MARRMNLIAFGVITLVATVGLPGSAPGSQLSPGSIEFSPTVSFSHSNLKREGYGNVDTSTDLRMTPFVGFCLTDRWEVMGGALVRHTSTNGNSDTNVGATAGLGYNFAPKGGVIPFGSAGFGVLFNDGFTFDNTAVLFPQLSAGIRVLVGNAASVNLSMGYERESDGHVRVNRMVSQVGVSLFPWHTR